MGSMNKHPIYDSCFYTLLEKKFRRELEHALEQRYTILIPIDNSFVAGSVDAVFVGYHIVRPSPLFADHFECYCDIPKKFLPIDRRHILEWDRDERTLLCKNSFTYAKKVEVLAKDIAYNESLQTYTILLISEPVHTPPSGRRLCLPIQKAGNWTDAYQSNRASRRLRNDLDDGTRMEQLTKVSGGPTAPPSYQEAKAYLLGVASFAPAVHIINEKVEYFNNTYMILPNFIDDTVDKLKSISDTAIQVLSCDAADDDKLLASCVDNYVSGLAHHKVFSSIKKFCKAMDADLERRLEFLRSSHVTAEALGVHEEAFFCELPQAIVELASLDSKYTPIDKLGCLGSTLRSVQVEVEEHWHGIGAQFYYKDEVPALTSDVLIPLVVLVMARSRPLYLASNIFYIEHFCGVKDDFSSFAVSTFKAAIEFVKKFNGNGLERGFSPRILKKELSLVDLMEMTASINESSSSGSLAIEAKTDDEDCAEDSHLVDHQENFLDEHQPEQTDLQRSPTQAKFPSRNSRQRSSLGRIGAGSGASATSASGVDKKLEEITRLIEKQTLDFHSKEEEHLRRLDNHYASRSSPGTRASAHSPSSSSLNSSSNSVAGEDAHPLFSPLSSLRRSLRQSKNF